MGLIEERVLAEVEEAAAAALDSARLRMPIPASAAQGVFADSDSEPFRHAGTLLAGSKLFGKSG
jgi:hypothetical protein